MKLKAFYMFLSSAILAQHAIAETDALTKFGLAEVASKAFVHAGAFHNPSNSIAAKPAPAIAGVIAAAVRTPKDMSAMDVHNTPSAVLLRTQVEKQTQAMKAAEHSSGAVNFEKDNALPGLAVLSAQDNDKSLRKDFGISDLIKFVGLTASMALALVRKYSLHKQIEAAPRSDPKTFRVSQCAELAIAPAAMYPSLVTARTGNLCMVAETGKVRTQKKKRAAVEIQNTGEVAASTPAEGLPFGWETEIDPASGNRFYFNRESGESRWDPPNQVAASAPAEGLPFGWETRTVPGSGNRFYFNRETGESRWDRPTQAMAMEIRSTAEASTDASMDQLKADVENFRRSQSNVNEEPTILQRVIDTLGTVLTFNFGIIITFFIWFMSGVVGQFAFSYKVIIDTFRSFWDPLIFPLLTTHMTLTFLSFGLEKVSAKPEP